MDFVYRPIEPGESEDVIRREAWAFGWHIRNDELHDYPSLREFDRTLAAFHDDQIAGNVRVVSSRMNVPGGNLPVGGIAMVWVQPTHRRQGLMTELIKRQIYSIHERGEPISVLTASEGSIYDRFGFGVGSVHETWSIDSSHVEFSNYYPEVGALRLVGDEEMIREFPEVYRKVTAERPGAIELSEHFWQCFARDFTPPGGQSEPLFHLVYENEFGIDGYACYRVVGQRVRVEELMAGSVQARVALWKFCLNMDLMSGTEAFNRPLDDPLPWMLADPRRLNRTTVDGLWVRLVDVLSALAGRRYMVPGNLVIEVFDSFCPWNQGRYELNAGISESDCRRTNRSPDISISVAHLASLYMGAVSLSTLLRAGRAKVHRIDSLSIADTMFSVKLKPWGPHGF